MPPTGEMQLPSARLQARRHQRLLTTDGGTTKPDDPPPHPLPITSCNPGALPLPVNAEPAQLGSADYAVLAPKP